MTTKTKIELLWQDILQKATIAPINSGEFRLVRLDPAYPFDIFAGIDGPGHVLLAIGIDTRPPNIDVGTQALDYFRQQRADGSWLMVLRLTRTGLEQVFGRLCQDLVDSAAVVPSQAALITLFRERLTLWRRLFQNGDSGVLEKHEIKGLMAELLSLEYLLKERPDAMAEIVMAWTGPLKADQDFTFAEHAIEIKAVSPHAEKVGIASVGQLDAAVPIELWLYILKESSLGEQGSVCLVDLAARLESQLSACPEGLAIFRERLLQAGYVEQEYYESAIFKIMGVNEYSVSEGFPRLPASVLPMGVLDVRYSLSISAIDSFKITSRSSNGD